MSIIFANDEDKNERVEREYQTKLTIILFVHGAGDCFAVVEQQSAIQTPLLNSESLWTLPSTSPTMSTEVPYAADAEISLTYDELEVR